ncbi:HepT-like ribonuclease domain-containing protein [Brasilonema sp. UFV-L1]|uniref:HepT-like ribonuclease domain-containing protein n=1 Tax=Brasilonema sp. UFV-L1 TaxID=2234130 RepID=UPI002006E9DF|nr:HepT-like ribonuclease domain-containing protein [Brasilonema sp. UFV-L1]
MRSAASTLKFLPKAVALMRDVLVHEYWGIDVNVVWATVHEGLPPLKAVIVEITRNLQNT